MRRININNQNSEKSLKSNFITHKVYKYVHASMQWFSWLTHLSPLMCWWISSLFHLISQLFWSAVWIERVFPSLYRRSRWNGAERCHFRLYYLHWICDILSFCDCRRRLKVVGKINLVFNTLSFWDTCTVW